MTFIRGMRSRDTGGEDAPFFENGPPPAFTAHEEAESLRRWQSEKRRQDKPDAPTARELTMLGGLAAALLGLQMAERVVREESGGAPEAQTAAHHAFGWDFPTTSAEEDLALAANAWTQAGGEFATGVGAAVMGPFHFMPGTAGLEDPGWQPRIGDGSGMPLPALALGELPAIQPAPAPVAFASAEPVTAPRMTAAGAGTLPGDLAGANLAAFADLPPDRESRTAEAPAEARPAHAASAEPAPQMASAPAPAVEAHEHTAAPTVAPTAPAWTSVAWNWTPPEPQTARPAEHTDTTPAASDTGHNDHGTPVASAPTPAATGGDAPTPPAHTTPPTVDVSISTPPGMEVAASASGHNKDDGGKGASDHTPPGLEVAAAAPGHNKDDGGNGASDHTPPGLEVAAAAPGHNKDDGGTDASDHTPPGLEVAAAAPGQAKHVDAGPGAPDPAPGHNKDVAAAPAGETAQVVADASPAEEKGAGKDKGGDAAPVLADASPAAGHGETGHGQAHDVASGLLDLALAALSGGGDPGHGPSEPVADASHAVIDPLLHMASAALTHHDAILG